MFDLNLNKSIIVRSKLPANIKKLLTENPKLEAILINSETSKQAIAYIKQWIIDEIKLKPDAYQFYKNEHNLRKDYEKLDWQSTAAIRILDTIDNEGNKYEDLNLRGKLVKNRPFEILWKTVHEAKEIAHEDFYTDMVYLFRQFNGTYQQNIPKKKEVEKWMTQHLSGLDERIVKLREQNKKRIINEILKNIDKGEINDSKYYFPEGISYNEKVKLLNKWWDEKIFHLRFAVKTVERLNQYLDYSLSTEMLDIMNKAAEKGIPIFINPYYLSLLNVNEPEFAKNTDLAIRQYILYSEQLIEEFGNIVAWEKEDVVEAGKPNAAGWILPSAHYLHRRYPEVAILIPATMGRACGGLCSSCQRMYGFQKGNLNFNIEKLKPKESWEARLTQLMEYFENDSQLRDILITGGDALMSQDKSLERILNAVYNMALRKKLKNENRPEDKQFAEILRVRLGTRLLAYLPQRVTPELTRVLKEFKDKASKIGVQQFVIQTHFESPLEVTPEAIKAIEQIISAGWIITNQLVFTSAASRRGHTAQLRKVLNDAGVITYYTFSVKGYKENSENFATNARAVQEQIEEKALGFIPEELRDKIDRFHDSAHLMKEKLEKIKVQFDIPFLATDRNVLNLPGVGKSLSFRTIGITEDGRRILEFDHDPNRKHSPIIHDMGKVVIIESKSITEYLQQLKSMDEDIENYETIWGYSIGATESRMSLYDYPEYDYKVTNLMTNLDVQN